MGRGREEGKRTLGLAALLGDETWRLAKEEESDEAGLGLSARQWSRTPVLYTHAGRDELNREWDPPLRGAGLSLEDAVRDPEADLLRQHDPPPASSW
jgi:hypothetical protein